MHAGWPCGFDCDHLADGYRSIPKISSIVLETTGLIQAWQSDGGTYYSLGTPTRIRYACRFCSDAGIIRRE